MNRVKASSLREHKFESCRRRIFLDIFDIKWSVTYLFVHFFLFEPRYNLYCRKKSLLANLTVWTAFTVPTACHRFPAGLGDLLQIRAQKFSPEFFTESNRRSQHGSRRTETEEEIHTLPSRRRLRLGVDGRILVSRFQTHVFHGLGSRERTRQRPPRGNG